MEKVILKSVSIKCETAEEVKKVLKICKGINIKWVDGQIATKYYPRNENYPKILNIDSNGISTCFLNGHYSRRYDLCTTNEFIEVKCKDLIFPKQEIHITRKDNEVHAILKENDKVIKRTVAKCHPEDEFDFKVGSKLAYGRLFEKDNKDGNSKSTKVNKPKHEFKVGDKVRIRQWNDMVEEFGLNSFNQIYTVPRFTQFMKPLCGQIATIIAFGKTFNGTPFIELKFNKTELDMDWNFYSKDMIEPYTPTIIKVGDRAQVLNGSGSCYKTGEIVTCIAINTDKNGELKYLFENDKCQWQILDWKDYKTLNNDTPLLTSLLNCKFTVVKDINGLTKGKIYEVKNGKFKDDDGDICPMSEKLLNEEDLKKYFRPLNSLDVEGSEIIIVIKD